MAKENRVARTYRMGLLRRLGNLFMTAAVLLRVPRHTVLLETVGAKSRRVRRTPVNVLRLDGERWLVAPYGLVGWVRNVQVTPRATLRRGLTGKLVGLEPVDADSAGPVLKAYWRAFPITRPFFDASGDEPPAVFAAEAARHPVFRIVAMDPAEKRAI